MVGHTSGSRSSGLKIALLTAQTSDRYESDKQQVLAEGIAYFETWGKMPVHLVLEYWWYDYEPYPGYEEDRAAYFSGLVLAEGISLTTSSGGRLAHGLMESDPQHPTYQALLRQLPAAVFQAIQEDLSFANAGNLRNRVTNIIAGKERKKERQLYGGVELPRFGGQ